MFDDYFAFDLPVHYIVALAYGDDSGLTDEEIELLEIELDSLPTGGVWEFDSEEYFTYNPDICLQGCTCVDAKYHFKTEE